LSGKNNEENENLKKEIQKRDNLLQEMTKKLEKGKIIFFLILHKNNQLPDKVQNRF
jgi:hypothetical protein